MRRLIRHTTMKNTRSKDSLLHGTDWRQSGGIAIQEYERKGMNARTGLMFLWTFLWSIVGTIAMILDPTGHLFSYLARRHWAKHILKIGGITCSIRGADGIDWSKPYVICVNHNSQVDIPLLFACLPTAIRFLAKRSLFYIPIFGWMLAIARFIPIDRGNKTKAKRSVEKAAKRIQKGPSLLVFPEGTRSADGGVQPFKSGAFIMAIKANVPILPVAVRGTFDIVPKHRLNNIPGPAELVIGKPIETETLAFEDRYRLRDQTRQAVVEMYGSGVPGS